MRRHLTASSIGLLLLFPALAAAQTPAPKLDRYGDPLPPGAVDRLGQSRFQYPGASVLFSPDKKSIVVLAWGRYVFDLDPATGAVRSRKTLPLEDAKSGVLFPDAKRALIQRPRENQEWMSVWEVWDLTAPKKIATLSTNDRSNNMESLSVSPDGTKLVGSTHEWNNVGQTYVCTLYDALTGKGEVIESAGVGNNGGTWPFKPCFSPDGSAVFHGHQLNQQKTVKCYDLKKKEQRWEYSSEAQGYFYNHQLSVVANAIMFPAQQKQVWLDITTGKEAAPGLPKEAAAAGMPMGISRDGHWIAFVKTGLLGRTFLQVWDVKGKKAAKSIETPKLERGYQQVQLSQDGKFAVLQAGGLFCYNLETGAKVWGPTDDRRPTGDVSQMVFTADGKRLVVGGQGFVQAWDVAAGKVAGDWKTGTSAPVMEWVGRHSRSYGPSQEAAFGISADGKRLAVAEGPGWGEPKIKIVELATGKTLGTAPKPPADKNRRHQAFPAAILLSPAGDSVVTSFSNDYNENFLDRSCSLARWDLGTNAWVVAGRVETGGVLRTGGSPSAGQFYVASKAYDTASGNEAFEFEGGSLEVIARSSNGRFVVGTGRMTENLVEAMNYPNIKDLRVWEAGTGRMIASLKWAPREAKDAKPNNGPRFPGDGGEGNAWAWPRRLAVHPSGRIVATSDYMGVRLWDAASGKPYHSVPMDIIPSLDHGMGRPATAVTFSPDGGRLATAMLDGTILLWDVPKPPSLDGKEDAAALWADLQGGDVAKAWRAAWRLTDRPSEAVKMAGERLAAVTPVDAVEVRKWIADLDSPKFRVRELASRRLVAVADRVVPELRAAYFKQASAEQRQRIDVILSQASGNARALSPTVAGTARAIAVLEAIGSPEARQLLAKLANGAPGAWLTITAKEAVDRLEARTAVAGEPKKAASNQPSGG